MERLNPNPETKVEINPETKKERTERNRLFFHEDAVARLPFARYPGLGSSELLRLHPPSRNRILTAHVWDSLVHASFRAERPRCEGAWLCSAF
jgi:hypothetical protein